MPGICTKGVGWGRWIIAQGLAGHLLVGGEQLCCAPLVPFPLDFTLPLPLFIVTVIVSIVTVVLLLLFYFNY